MSASVIPVFENWNRFYDSTGRYTAADPLNEGEHGVPLSKNSYAYADSSPFANVDPTGHIVVNYDAMRTKLKGSTRATASLERLHKRKDYFVIGYGVPKDEKGNELWGQTVPPKTSEGKLTVLIINEGKIEREGDTKGNYLEVFGHEMSHGEQARPGQTASDYLAQDAEAYSQSISIRLEQGLTTDATWLDAHPAVEWSPAGKPFASKALKNQIVNDAVTQIRGGRPVLPPPTSSTRTRP